MEGNPFAMHSDVDFRRKIIHQIPLSSTQERRGGRKTTSGISALGLFAQDQAAGGLLQMSSPLERRNIFFLQIYFGRLYLMPVLFAVSEWSSRRLAGHLFWRVII